MRLRVKIAVAVAALALGASPAALAMGKPEGTPPHGNGQAHGQEGGSDHAPGDGTPGPKAGLPAKAKAYGRYCKGESKKHVKGEKGTAFSRCVTNMAQAATQGEMAPGRVCKGESKKHVKGEKGTAFSRCVRGVAKLRHQEHKEEHEHGREEGA
jgi:hypothetical protein